MTIFQTIILHFLQFLRCYKRKNALLVTERFESCTQSNQISFQDQSGQKEGPFSNIAAFHRFGR